MVVEHDLTLLDYLQTIFILYGEPSAYGIVAPIQGTRVGINSLMGLFRRNIRFRENHSSSMVQIK